MPAAVRTGSAVNCCCTGNWRRESVLISLIVLLLVVWLILNLLGLLVKGLFWLIVVGTVLFVATAIVGWVKRNA